MLNKLKNIFSSGGAKSSASPTTQTISFSPKQQAQFVAWVEAGPDPVKDGVVRWRCVDLQARVEEEFDVKLHMRTIGKYLTKHGFCRLSVRPEHPETDREAQQTFKKPLPAS
jgi:transposase